MLRFEKKNYTICLHLNRFENGKEKNSPQTGFQSNTCTSAEMLKHLFHLIEVILLNLHKEMFSSNVS